MCLESIAVLMQECWFDAEAFFNTSQSCRLVRSLLLEVQYGPDEHGVYHVVWADGTPSFREVGIFCTGNLRITSAIAPLSATRAPEDPADSREVHGSQLLRLDSDKVPSGLSNFRVRML